MDMSRNAAVLLSTVLYGCAVFTPLPEMPPFEGETTLGHTLRREGYATAFAFARSSGCSEIDRVITSTVSPPLGQPMSLFLTERWVLHGCDRMYPFLVNVSGDGEGGTVVDVQSDF